MFTVCPSAVEKQDVRTVHKSSASKIIAGALLRMLLFALDLPGMTCLLEFRDVMDYIKEADRSHRDETDDT
jgi:hypothetical protein